MLFPKKKKKNSAHCALRQIPSPTHQHCAVQLSIGGERSVGTFFAGFGLRLVRRAINVGHGRAVAGRLAIVGASGGIWGVHRRGGRGVCESPHDRRRWRRSAIKASVRVVRSGVLVHVPTGGRTVHRHTVRVTIRGALGAVRKRTIGGAVLLLQLVLLLRNSGRLRLCRQLRLALLPPTIANEHASEHHHATEEGDGKNDDVLSAAEVGGAAGRAHTSHFEKMVNDVAAAVASVLFVFCCCFVYKAN